MIEGEIAAELSMCFEIFKKYIASVTGAAFLPFMHVWSDC